MAQNTKHSFNGHRKQSVGFNQANMHAFMYTGTKRKRRKEVRGK
ncbi:hypothetical protein [Faecalicatena contorta]|jgi:hypothetical protein|nr:hypothetical protein [Faecalicatena contorta]